MQHQ
jgi:hypothetical protein